ncbi:3-deoxy-D-manno-octulosonic acid transferase [Falsihalocynthiibacter sp. S25ZX9]|uniref:3-deoxy-D-manno-octulosonic acid transferase n=1 Tax=Falsihalocynthiibacter sp. S25ZX9 TaxID=3240870 RepID=UPI00350EC297
MSFSLSLFMKAQTRRTAEVQIALESENSPGAAEEMGIASVERPRGVLVWLHAPDVAKAHALTKLIRQLSEDWPSVHFLVTTPRNDRIPFTTDALPRHCFHQFSPAEVPIFVENFLKHWKPDLAVFAGIDTGPITVLCTSNSRIPLFLIDAKLDARSFSGVRDRFSGQRSVMREVLRRFNYIDTVDASSAKALSALGIEGSRITISGPIEEVSTTLPCNEEDRTHLAKVLVGRPVWFASNIPKVEESIVLNAHMTASRTAHRLLLILSPDSSQRGSDLADEFAQKGLRVKLRSLGEIPDDETQIYIADTDGERGLWYRLATVSFLGCSLAAGHAIQSPFEAAGLGSAILHGPNLGTHRKVYEALNSEGGARQVGTTTELTNGLLSLLAPDQSAAMAHSAWDLTTKGARATDLAVARIETMLEDIGAF